MTSATWSETGTGLGTSTRIIVTNEAVREPAAALLAGRVRQLDAVASRFRDDSELSAVNRAAGRAVRIGALLCDVVSASLEMAEATSGLVDPTVGAAVIAAGYDRTYDWLPRRPHVTRLYGPAETTWRDVRLQSEEAGTWLTVPLGVRLDLGAVGKAWLADRVALEVADRFGCGVLVDLGGDIAIAGDPPAGGWLVGVPPAGDAAAQETVRLVGGGLATSGQGGRRWWTATGPAHHVVDPRTGQPAVTPWWTVTVHAQTCAQANAASTAALILGEYAGDWLAAAGLSARLIPESGRPRLVGAWPAPHDEQITA